MEKKSGSDAAVCHCIIDSSIFSLVVSVSWFCCTPLTNLHVDVKSPPPGPAPSAAAAFFWEAWLEHRWHIDSSDYATERPIPSEFFRPRPGESESSKSHAGAPDRRRHRTQPQAGSTRTVTMTRNGLGTWTRQPGPGPSATLAGAAEHLQQDFWILLDSWYPGPPAAGGRPGLGVAWHSPGWHCYLDSWYPMKSYMIYCYFSYVHDIICDIVYI